MNDREQLMSDIIVALTKLAGGTIWLAHTTLERNANETVYVERQENGSLVLKLKDVTTFEGVQDA